MRVYVEGIGLLAPGLSGWAASAPILAGSADYVSAPIAMPVLELLPPAERRRTPASVKLALAAGSEALANAAQPAADTATVFTSSGGDGDVIHQICEALALPGHEVSPTRFHNSVHNASAGYWGIATRCHEPSTSLGAYDASFAAGLIEAATQAIVDPRTVLLIAYDTPYPEPINAVRPIRASVGVGMLLSPERSARSLCALDINLVSNSSSATLLPQPDLEALRAGVPAGRALPLLVAIAAKSTSTIVLDYMGANALQIRVSPCS